MTYDTIGNIAIIKFDEEKKISEKKKFAQKILENHKNIKTVLEKLGKVQGRLRTIKTKHLAGIRTKEAEYRENGCLFKFNVETCYFSPRLSEERKRITSECKAREKILVMFGGVAPYAIIIAKNKPEVKEVVSVELGKECNKYAKINTKINKVEKKVEVMPGDVKRILPRMNEEGRTFDRIVMTRPQLEETFIKQSLMVARKGTIIHYHGFAREEERERMIEDLKREISEVRREVKIINVMKVGDIAPRKYRWRIDLKVTN